MCFVIGTIIIIGMSMEDVRKYEIDLQKETNRRVLNGLDSDEQQSELSNS